MATHRERIPHDNHIKHGTASSQLIIVNKVLYHGLVRNFAGKSQKWHLFAITRLPVDNIFEGFPLDEMRKVAAAMAMIASHVDWAWYPPLTCGVTRRFGASHKGSDSGSGSGVATSIAAPARCPL